MRQQNRKLFAAVARSYVNFSERRAQTLRDDLQRAIPGLMAVAVVVELEIVNVNHHKAHRIVVSPRSAQLFRQSRFHITPVVQAGKRIRDRHQLELIRALLPGGPFQGQSDLRPHQFDDAQVSRTIRGATYLVGEIQNADLALANCNRIANERFSFIAPRWDCFPAQLVHRSHQCSPFAKN